MSSKLKAAALRTGGKIHPLMGPIFTGRPNSTGVGDTCSMCIGSTPGNADTKIRDSNGRTTFICLAHEFMLYRAFDAPGRDGVTEYEAYVLDSIMEGVTRPRWMPARLHARLQARAAHWAHLLALSVVVPKARPLIDARAIRAEAAAAELDRNRKKLTD